MIIVSVQLLVQPAFTDLLFSVQLATFLLEGLPRAFVEYSFHLGLESLQTLERKQL